VEVSATVVVTDVEAVVVGHVVPVVGLLEGIGPPGVIVGPGPCDGPGPPGPGVGPKPPGPPGQGGPRPGPQGAARGARCQVPTKSKNQGIISHWPLLGQSTACSGITPHLVKRLQEATQQGTDTDTQSVATMP
jgi:hypothetical protein